MLNKLILESMATQALDGGYQKPNMNIDAQYDDRLTSVTETAQ